MQSELLGYADRLSVPPGESIKFMVSTDAATYDVQLVRLIHGDNNPAGPGYKEAELDSPINGRRTGRKQPVYAGSFVHVPHNPALDLTSFTLTAWIWPTTPAAGRPQGIISKWSDNKGYGLFVGENGALELWLGDGENIERVNTGVPMRRREWYFVAATYDAAAKTAALYQINTQNWQNDPSGSQIQFTTQISAPALHTSPLTIGAGWAETYRQGYVGGMAVFNGKIDRPRVFDQALHPVEVNGLRASLAPQGFVNRNLVAEWAFQAHMDSEEVSDIGRNKLHGQTVNMPTRAVTGHNWTGSEVDFRRIPDQYSALHFHEDDLDNAHWDVDFELPVPQTLKSGIYAARLRSSDGEEDYIPFTVRAPRGRATAPALFLLPTNTYLAYANFRLGEASIDENRQPRQAERDPMDKYLLTRPELAMSLYDLHADGSPCVYSSYLRPIVGMRPKHRTQAVGGPRHFPADLYLIDWMDEKGIPYDVATDEDLHFDGTDLLSQYKVIVTGTHPEYWTTPMLTALENYLDGSGRLMYMGGDGFYWVTSVDPNKPHVVEVRRGVGGTRTWESPPGEFYHSTTSEPGGLWRYRGKAPNRVAGIGFTSMPYDGKLPGYKRQPGSFDPRAAFIFAGIGDDEILGDFGLVMGSTAADEIDRVDYGLGTPAHTLILATASDYPPATMPVIEDFTQFYGTTNAGMREKVRADMVYFETPGGGEVFSTGSITWCSGLSHNNYDNNISRIMENVLRKFSE